MIPGLNFVPCWKANQCLRLSRDSRAPENDCFYIYSLRSEAIQLCTEFRSERRQKHLRILVGKDANKNDEAGVRLTATKE